MNVIRKGWNKKQTKRRFKCKDCSKKYVEGGKDYFVDQDKIELNDRLLLERLSLRGICRAVKVSLSWLLAYIKRLYDKVPEDLYFKPMFKAKKEQGKCYIRLIKSELDEIKKTSGGFGWHSVVRHPKSLPFILVTGAGKQLENYGINYQI